MLCLVENALVGSKTIDEYTDKKTGEIRHYYKVTLCQDGAESMELSIEEDLFHRVNRASIYDFKLDIFTFNGKRLFKLVDAVPASDPDFLSGELDIA